MNHDECNHLGDCNQMASGPLGGRSEPQIDCLLITRHSTEYLTKELLEFS